MEKPAGTQYPILDLIARRWSPRVFADRMVEPEKLRSLFEAARWAPSCFNQQPWNFLVAARNDGEEFDRLVSCLVSANLWAAKAPVLALSVVGLDFAHNGKPNPTAQHDVGLAVENLVIQAISLGIFVHQMAGFDVEKARELFQIPARHDPVAMIALGYPGDPELLPAELRQREMAGRTRKTIDQFVFMGRWNQPSPLVGQVSVPGHSEPDH